MSFIVIFAKFIILVKPVIPVKTRIQSLFSGFPPPREGRRMWEWKRPGEGCTFPAENGMAGFLPSRGDGVFCGNDEYLKKFPYPSSRGDSVFCGNGGLNPMQSKKEVWQSQHVEKWFYLSEERNQIADGARESPLRRKKARFLL